MKWHVSIAYKKTTVAFMLLSLALLIAGCSSKTEPDISIYYTANSEEYIHNAYGFGTKDAYKNLEVYESLDEAIEKGKTIITMVDGIQDNGLKATIIAFNLENDKYHIEREVFNNEEMKEKVERLKMELVAGKGPDIMSGSAMQYASEIMDKECFVDLAPLMKESGFSDDSYFPFYKALTYKEHVYGLSPYGSVTGCGVKEEVIGGDEIPSFEEFVDDVLYYPENAIFFNNVQKYPKILGYFLNNSETLWGMIDWENCTCDFTVDLFSKILDIAKRYGDATNKGYEPIMIIEPQNPGSYPEKKYYEENGWVTVDYWFDDGNYPEAQVSFETLMINSNTKNLEGAWAFVSYCMSERGQSYETSSPANKKAYTNAYEDMRALYKSEAEAEKYYSMSAIENYKELLENGRYAPYKTEPILNIILEETEAFFSGAKNKEQVIEIIQNRVSLFLKENN